MITAIKRIFLNGHNIGHRLRQQFNPYKSAAPDYEGIYLHRCTRSICFSAESAGTVWQAPAPAFEINQALSHSEREVAHAGKNQTDDKSEKLLSPCEEMYAFCYIFGKI